jgi:hypothetical protein
VRVARGSGTLTVIAESRRHGDVRLRLVKENRSDTVLTFTSKLGPGRWRVTVTCGPAAGNASPAHQQRDVTIPS